MTIQQRDYRYHRHYETPKERQRKITGPHAELQDTPVEIQEVPRRILWESGYDPWTQSVARKAQH